MKELLQQIKVSVIITLVLGVLLCGVYPLTVWAIGQVFFSSQANGSLITASNGQVIGSKLIGQTFTGAQYFEPRPSYAGAGYDPTASSGSNLGPTSQKLATNVAAAVMAYRTDNNLSATTAVPADAVTGSASGLDADISLDNAAFQAPRVAEARHTSLANIQALVTANTDPKGLGFLGEAGINVLTLNIALDQRYPVGK